MHSTRSPFLSRFTRWSRRLFGAKSNKAKTTGTPVRDLVADVLGHYGTTVLDVGARWADTPAWWRIDPVANLVGFEPDADECTRLNEKSDSPRKERYLPLALGATRQESVLYQTAEPACASLYPPDETLAERFPQLSAIRLRGSKTISLMPLDEWWESEDRPSVSFLKLDTQGSELDILRGAERVLESCVGLEVEAEFSPLYKGQPLFADIDVFLRAHGFSLWGFRHLCKYSEQPESANENGRLYWGDAVYFRDYRSLGEGDEAWRRSLILSALLEAYGDRAASRSCLKRALQDLSEPAPALPPRLVLSGNPT